MYCALYVMLKYILAYPLNPYIPEYWEREFSSPYLQKIVGVVQSFEC